MPKQFVSLKKLSTTLQTARYNLKVQQWIAALSIVLFLIKSIAWWLTNSVAVLTDALESIVNVVAGLIGVYSLYVSAKPKDEDHPYGHGKVEFISAAVEGTLVTVAGILIIYEAVHSFLHPSPIKKVDYGIILVAATGAVNYFAGVFCVNTGKKNNSLALIASGRHLQSDTVSTIGIVAGLILIYCTKIAWIDSAVALLFAGFIIYTGYKILRSSIAGIMDEADEALLEKMVTTLNQARTENWIDLHNLRIIKYGGTIHIDCHMTVPWYLNINEAHAEIDRLSDLVKQEYSGSVELFIHTDGCLPTSCPICSKADCPVRRHQQVRKVEWTMTNISKNEKHDLNTN